jgi:nucleotide-binding universal stress UspA family protein
MFESRTIHPGSFTQWERDVTYRSLMVHLNLEHSNEAALRIAGELAGLFKSQVIGVAAGFPNAPVHADGMIAASVLEADDEQIKQAIDRCESRFRAAMTPLGHPLQWRADVANAAEFLATQARAADLLIVGRHADDSVLVPSQSLDIGDAVMRAGRPVLLVPPDKTCLAPDRILIAWKDTTEARRAVSAALPLLKRAKDVQIIEIVAVGDEQQDAARRVADVAAWLQRHGVTAQATAALSAGNAGSHLDLLAAQNKTDVVVAGAYGHSRLREWVFGGVTHHLIHRATACTFLVH